MYKYTIIIVKMVNKKHMINMMYVL